MNNFIFIGSICLVALALAQDPALPGTVSLIVNKPSEPDVYNGEKLKFQCDFQLEEELTVAPDYVTLRGTTVGVTEQWFAGCSFTKLPGSNTGTYTPLTTMKTNKIDVDMVNEICGALSTDPAGSYRITVDITVVTKFEYECYLSAGNRVLLSNKEEIPELKTAPQNLVMDITPPTALIPEDTFSVLCTSDGGEPASVFKYGIGEEQLPATNSLEARPGYNGAKVWCYDETHNNLNGGNTSATWAEKTIIVYYLQVKPEVHLELNPNYNKPLVCEAEQNLPPNVSLMYTWSKDDTVIDGEISKEYTITRGQNNNETSTKYACTVFATNGEQEITDKLGEKTITFNITWSVEAKTTTTTTEKSTEKPTEKPKVDNLGGKPEKKDNMIIVIIVVVIVVVVVIIIIVVIVVIKKRSSSGSKELKSKTTSDTEKGKGEDAAEPMLPSGESKPAETGAN